MGARSFTAALVLAASALTGCGGGSDAPSDDGSGSPSDAGSPAARAAPPTLAELQDALVEADTGRVTSAATLGGLTIKRSGVYRISDLAARVTTKIEVPGTGTLTFASIAIDDTAYVQIDNGNGFRLEKCWLTYDTDTISAATGSALPTDATAGVPPEVLALLNAEEDGRRTTIGLYEAAASFSNRAPGALGIEGDTTARMPIRLTTGNRTVTVAWSFAGVVEAAEAAGVDVPAGAASGASDTTTFRGTISKPGTSVRITAPPADRQVPFDPTGEDPAFESAVAACEAR